MNLNWIKLTVIIAIFVDFPSVCSSQDYCTVYPFECTITREFYKEHKDKFDRAAQLTGLPAPFLFSIVAPEISQFSYLSNKLETYSLKVMYVQGGADYANFSIGYFQMKPSFVERLEQYVQADASLKNKYSYCLFTKPQERAARVSRIDRLSDLDWQIKYLIIFCEILKQRFNDKIYSSTADRLQFYASAYNCGFHKTEQEIRKTGQLAFFPFFSIKKYKYSEISMMFYQQLFQK